MIQLLSDLVDSVFLVLLVWSAVRSVRGLMGGGRVAGFGGRRRPGKAERQPAGGGNTERDPVCGMFVSTELSHQLVQSGKTLHFCSEQCLRAYKNSAAKAS